MHTLAAPPSKKEIRSNQPSPYSRASSPASRNLYDLFVEEISSLSASTQHASRTAIALCDWLPPDQLTLKEMAKGFADDAIACAESIASALRTEQLELAPCLSDAGLIDALLPSRYDDAAEPWGVAGIRVVSAFRQLSLRLAVKSDEAAEFGFLLGADAVHSALRHWSDKWEKRAKRLKLARSGFCAAAYIADVDSTASFHRPASFIQS